MKVLMLRDEHGSICDLVSQRFEAGTTPDLPDDLARTLVAIGAASLEALPVVASPAGPAASTAPVDRAPPRPVAPAASAAVGVAPPVVLTLPQDAPKKPAPAQPRAPAPAPVAPIPSRSRMERRPTGSLSGRQDRSLTKERSHV